MRLVPAAFWPGRRVRVPLSLSMAPETLSPMLVLRLGVVVAVAGVRRPPTRLRVVGVVAVPLVRGVRGPKSLCFMVGFVPTARVR